MVTCRNSRGFTRMANPCLSVLATGGATYRQYGVGVGINVIGTAPEAPFHRSRQAQRELALEASDLVDSVVVNFNAWTDNNDQNYISATLMQLYIHSSRRRITFKRFYKGVTDSKQTYVLCSLETGSR